MPRYNYTAINETGATVKDAIEAESADAVSSMLSARGYIPIGITVQSAERRGFSLARIKEGLTPIKAPELILFTKQFRTMLRAGVSMINLMQILEGQSENARLKRIIREMSRDVREGSSLYGAFRKHSKVFSPLYCGMVHAGEVSGALPEVLDRLTYIIDHENKIRSDIRAALQYPIFVLFFLMIAFFVLLTFVIPRFVRIFLGAGLELPVPTQICLALYHFIDHYWGILLGAAVGIGIFLYYYLRTDQGRYVRDAALMRIPVLGPLFVKAAMSRFASIFSILQSSGVSVLESMKILGTTVGNTAISREFDMISDRLEEGRGIAEPLRRARYFTPIVINMVAIGEESGNLDEMLSEISNHYDVEVEYAMKKLTDAIGPLLTIGLACVVGFFALAIFLPMWDLVGIAR